MRISRPFYGWYIVGVAALAMVATLPGRTQGLGLITEPLLRDLQIDRLAYARLNFWATIVGSLGALGIGRLIDRFGSRIVLTVVSIALGLVVCAMSRATTVAAMIVLVTLTRGFGQSALSVVSITMVGQWFTRRVDMAMAVYSILLSIGFMAAFPAVGALIQSDGWRFAWLMVGLGVIAVAPIAWAIVRRNPDAAVSTSEHSTSEIAGDEWKGAITTGTFWVFAIGAALYGLVASGIGLFNESILAERGLGPTVYYNALVITAMTSLAGNFLGGWLATRVPLSYLLATSMVVLAAGVALLPLVRTSIHVMVWATAMGIGGGLVMVLFFSAWPRLFGRRHLGQIQGTAQALTVLASAVGPWLLAACVTWTGSYAQMFRVLAAVIFVTAVAALIVPANITAPWNGKSSG